MAILYENIFKKGYHLYARTYDTETKESTLSPVKFVPTFFIKDPQTQDAPYKSVLTKEPLKELHFSSMKDYKDNLNLYTSSGVTVYGNPKEEQCYIRQNWPVPTDSDHQFHTWYIDIETMVDKDDPYHDAKLDWKPSGSPRSASAIITSIQIYDTKHKEFYIFGLGKEWANDNNYESPHGKINYWNMSTEENLLKAFIGLMSKRNPTLIVGFNSFGYDFPYITNRVVRILDGRNDLYVQNQKGEYVYNREVLTGSWVQQLSPVGLIKHKEVETNFGKQDEFEWVGYFMEDYQVLFKKYTYTVLTSYSLESVASHELGVGKVEHDEFTDFGDFYKNAFNLFIEYGVKDVELLIELDAKLKLIDLAKYIAYTCGVNFNDVSGTVKQWNSFMYNEFLNVGLVLPVESQFSSKDPTLLMHAANMTDLSPERKQFFAELLNHTDDDGKQDWVGQRFAGGVTRGTGRFWKWVFSLDFTSLYPSNIMWANIGIDTLILPKDLPKELLDIRAKYAIYYPQHTEPKDLEKYDHMFIDDVLLNPVAAKELHDACVKYNVSMSPNGMFFRKDRRAIASEIMERMISQRKIYKKEMKGFQQQIEDIKAKEFQTEDDKKEIERLTALEEKANVYQMGVKILINSYYGSLSMKAAVSAGHAEYFSTAVTSVGRVANLLVSREQTKKIHQIVGQEAKEIAHGRLNYLDEICQIDTDSCYLSLEKVLIHKFGPDYEKEQTRERLIEFTLNYINKVAMPVVRTSLDDVYAYACNASMPEKLQEDPEVICDNFISIAPKMYFARKYWDEGVTLAKPKLKITGLSTVRSSTPKFYRGELKSAMDILIDGDLENVVKYIESVKAATYEQKPSDICINQGVSSLDYEYDETVKKWRKWNVEKKKYAPAPVNSRASLVHNKYVNDNNMSEIKEIEAGDKISFIYMKMPNVTGSNAFAFRDERVFDKGLKDYIDYDTMFDKGFLTPIKLITDPLKWDLTPKDQLIDEDEW